MTLSKRFIRVSRPRNNRIVLAVEGKGMSEIRSTHYWRLAFAAIVATLSGAPCLAQANAPAETAKAIAPFDMTGYWVSVITQNWRIRMVTPPRGDYMGIPLTDASKRIADAWDPAKDEAAGNQCKYYGAGTIMTLPERLHITWQDDNTLKMDIDAGTQTRIFNFGNAKAAEGGLTWQGTSHAAWTARTQQFSQRIFNNRGLPPPPPAALTFLKVRTDRMKGGYLRKNGVPYSDNAVLTEYFDSFHEPDGQTWMIVTTILTDPVYLDDPLILTGQFRKQSDATGWDPTPCSARW
jgi:hypothetical protein